MVNLSRRVSTADLQRSKLGSTLVLAGWVENFKHMGKVAFIKLRDRNGYAQVVITPSYSKLKDLNLTRESVVAVRGNVKKSKAKSGGKELELMDIEILSSAKTPLPIEFLGKDIETDLSKRLDYRYIDLRNPKNLAIFKVLSTFNHASKEFFAKEGLIEIFSPKLIATPSEGGGEEFVVPYFKKKAYLAQSPQFYKQMAQSAGFEGVFEIAPVFRANPSHTIRHDTEFTSLDVEISWIDDEGARKFEERWLNYVMKEIKKRHGQEIKRVFGKDVVVPKLPFPRITMSEALKISKIKGDDLDPEAERKVCAHTKKKYGHDFVFVTEYPWSIRPFYHMKPEDKNKTMSFDLLYNGVEITTGAAREHRYDILKSQAQEKGLSVKSVQFYLDFFKWGCPPHAGFGFSPTRFVMLLLGLGNVRESTFAPRDTDRLTP